jgi:quercetin dioxygenase-like cupin family protein
VIVDVIRAAEGTSEDSSGAAIFQGGSVWARRVLGGDTGRGQQISLGVVQFAAGARTKRHVHTSDQLLYVVSGIGKVGAGDEEHVITNGDVVRIPAGEDHWHGAADTGSPMSHLSIMANDSVTTVVE